MGSKKRASPPRKSKVVKVVSKERYDLVKDVIHDLRIKLEKHIVEKLNLRTENFQLKEQVMSLHLRLKEKT